jgi:hypothetical protein
MAWISTGYLDNLLGQSTRLAVAPTTAVFDQFEGSARAKVVAVLQHAGYASPGTALTDGSDATHFLRMLASAQWCREAFGNRKGIKFPPAITDAFGLLDAVWDKKIPVPGLQPATADGFGGSRFSATSGTNAREQRFSRSKLSGF